MIITIRMNRDDKDIEESLIDMTNSERANAMKKAYRQALSHTELIELLKIETKNSELLEKIASSITKNGIKPVEVINEDVQTDKNVAEESSLSEEQKAFIESMNDFGSYLNGGN